jgi:hypothetical protein
MNQEPDEKGQQLRRKILGDRYLDAAAKSSTDLPARYIAATGTVRAPKRTPPTRKYAHRV